MAAERISQYQQLPHSPNWWFRATFNPLQLGVVVIGGLAWGPYLQRINPLGVDHGKVIAENSNSRCC